MPNLSFNELLPFAEFCIQVKNEIILIEGYYDEAPFDLGKLKRVLNLVKDNPYWIEFNEISNLRVPSPLQIDLLGNLKEPCLLLRASESNSENIYLIKFKVYEESHDIYYGKDQKFLIEIIAKTWVKSLNKDKGNEISDDSKFLYVSINQHYKLSNLNHRLKDIENSIIKTYKQLLNYFLKEKLTPEESIELSKSTIDYLQAFEFDFEELKQLSLKAFEIAKALNPHSTIICIEGEYFITNTNSNALPNSEAKYELLKPLKANLPSTPPNSHASPLIAKDTVDFISSKNYSKKNENLKLGGDNKLNKTIQLLNRYEEAVKLLISNNVPVMGKNISAACEPPISAPALTDSINKHHDRIIDCLIQNPTLWSHLRKNYLPIQKLDKK